MLSLELLAPGRCQPIILRPPVVLGHLPLGGNPTLEFEPLQGRVERAEFDIERLTRTTANRLGDPIAMQGCQQQRSKNQHVERSLEEIHMETLYMKNATIASLSVEKWKLDSPHGVLCRATA